METFIAAFGVMVIVAIAEGFIISRMQREQIKRMRRLKRKMNRAQKEQEELLQMLEELRATPPRFIRSGDLPVEMTEVTEDETW